MPITPTDPPSIGALPEAPSRFTDTPDEFSQKAEDWSDALPPYSDDVEAVADWTNETAEQVYSNADEANSAASSSVRSSSDSQVAAQISEASANFIGVWGSLTGSVSIGESVLHNSAYWVALVAIADITTSEPGASSDWSATGSLLLARYSKLDNPLCHLFKKNNLEPTIDGSITWSRSTVAYSGDRYGIIKQSAIDEPRQVKDFWLIEGASTNDYLYSDDFTDSNWSDLRSTAQCGVATAPDGTATACKIIDSTDSGTHSQRQLSTVTSGVPYTVSCYAKFNTKNIGFEFRSSSFGSRLRVAYDISAGTLAVVEGTVDSARIEPLADGWYRCSATATAVASETAYAVEICIIDGNSFFYTGDGAGEVYIWRSQFENLQFASSNMPTTSAPAARGLDDVEIDAEGNFPDSNSSWSMALWSNPFLAKPGGNMVTMIDASDLPGVWITVDSSSVYGAARVTDGTTFVTGLSAQIEDKMSRLLLTYDGSILAFYVDGVLKNKVTVSGQIRSPIGGSVFFGSSNYSPRGDFKIWDYCLNQSEALLDAGY